MPNLKTKLISNGTITILQGAIEQELFATLFYENVANECLGMGLLGAAKFFRGEAEDERGHYRRIADFMNDMGVVAQVPSIKAPGCDCESLQDALVGAYELERSLGDKYKEWHRKATSEDPITAQFLLQFLEIQRTSTGEYGDLLARLKAGGDSAVILIDQEMGK